MLKYSFNLIDDGLVGQQLFAGETTRLAYMTDEAVEGRDQFLEKREPDWSAVPLVLLAQLLNLRLCRSALVSGRRDVAGVHVRQRDQM